MVKKGHRLTSNYEFNKTRNFGRPFAGKYSRIFCLKLKTPSDTCRIGIVVTKKFGASAVERNRVKRVYRDILRKKYNELSSGYWIVVYPRKDFWNASYEEISTDLNSLLQKASILG